MRTERGELLSAACGLALLIVMFAFAWYGVDGIPGRGPAHGVQSTLNGWDGLTGVRWVMLLTALVVTAGPVLRQAQAWRTGGAQLTLALGTLTSLLLVYRVMIDLPEPPSAPDQKLGAVLGLAAALGIALGGWESVLRARQRLSGRRRAR